MSSVQDPTGTTDTGRQTTAPDAPDVATKPTAPGGPDSEKRIFVATQRQLIWWRFRKHKLAMVSLVIVALFYLMGIFADFLAYSDPQDTSSQRVFIPPQAVSVFDGWRPSLSTHPLTSQRDPVTFQREYVADENTRIPVGFFVHGYEYKLFGLIPTDIHLLGAKGGARTEDSVFLLGTDELGRDIFSRLLIATRTSLLIGLAGVAMSIALGVILGGISGFYGGITDTIIQRVIEILRSIPTIPLWMGVAAAMPKTWSIERVYFAITLIISVIGWTELGRVVRGRVLQIRDEDFVTAAELSGSRPRRIIFSHIVPLFTSHIIAATTLALPLMIIAETSLSFLNLGLRPPAISWGVMLQQAQNIQTVALSPWMMVPVIPVVAAILAFNFLGDGLRDAADPYS
jgi:peptide/nickel transport system permease protein